MSNSFKLTRSNKQAGPQKITKQLLEQVDVPPTLYLLPPSATNAKQRNVIYSWLLVGLLAGAAAIAFAYYYSKFIQNTSQTSLQQVQNEEIALITEQAQYGELQKTLSEIAIFEAANLEIEGNNIDWLHQLPAVSDNLPNGVTLSSVSLQLTDANPDDNNTESYFELTIRGLSSNITRITQYSDSLSAIPAHLQVIGPRIDSQTIDDRLTYNFQITVVLSADIFFQAGE